MGDTCLVGGLQVVIRRASLQEIIDLRDAVIIAGTARTSPEFPGDRDDTTHHFGVFEGHRAVCCATFLASEWEGRPAWQLRGMGTVPEYRSRGLGAAMLEFAETALRKDTPGRWMWCNARTPAVSFYERHGWQTVSAEFLIEGVGLHYRMVKRL